MNRVYTTYADSPRARLRAFALCSVILHGIALASWQRSPWMVGQESNVISVTLVSDRTTAASAEAHLTVQPARRIVHRADNNAVEKPAETTEANHGHVRAMALPAASAKTVPMGIDSRAKDSRPAKERPIPVKDTKLDNARDTSSPIPASSPAIGEDGERNRAKAEIQARLYTDLARYFDYPYVARLRGWEGKVVLAFLVESDGRLEDIHVARSSGYAVLDDSALSALRKVERLAEAAAWLRGRELPMQLPVIYRLRRQNQIAGNDATNF